MPIEKSAGAVIFRRHNKKIYYLLLRYELGHWDYVKGHIGKGEKSTDTLLREAKEEAGLADLKIIPGFKYNIRYFFRGKKIAGDSAKALDGKNHARQAAAWLIKAPSNEIIMKFVTFFLAETKTKPVRLSYEHTDYKWLSYKKAREQLSFENAKEVLGAANKFLVEVIKK